jgi:hypothetical protein
MFVFITPLPLSVAVGIEKYMPYGVNDLMANLTLA